MFPHLNPNSLKNEPRPRPKDQADRYRSLKEQSPKGRPEDGAFDRAAKAGKKVGGDLGKILSGGLS